MGQKGELLLSPNLAPDISRVRPRERFLDTPPPPINFIHGSYRKCLT